MGLDMFLFKVKREEVAYWRKANAIHAWFERRLQEDNDGLENCKDYHVSKEDLLELRRVCEQVINSSKVEMAMVKNGSHYNNKTNTWDPIYEPGKVIVNKEIAEELLPTTEGFFFGSTDYDSYYLDDLKETIEQIDKVLETTDFDKEDVVYCAWW